MATSHLLQRSAILSSFAHSTSETLRQNPPLLQCHISLSRSQFLHKSQSVQSRSLQRRSSSTVVRAQSEKNSSAPPPAKAEEKVPEWAKAGSEELPPWARGEAAKGAATELPFGVYLLFSVFTAIAAVGSIFEYQNQNLIFGVIGPDSGLYAPILGFFALTGFPMAGFLWYKAVNQANKQAEQMDKEDGVQR